MLKRIMSVALLLSACSAGPPDTAPPEWVVGNYHYSGSGTLAGKFPWQAKSRLVLDRDGQYTLSIEVYIKDEKGGDTDFDESYGTYYVEGNKLFLQSASDEQGDIDEIEIRGDRLKPKIPWPARVALKGFKVPDPVFVKTK